ncbi:MAG: OmpH family outer membrane protein [Cyanobacteria bacterium P01_B01_bin.77]
MPCRSWCNLPKVAGFAIAAATSMITPAHAELLVTPEAITLAGTRNSTVSTTLTLSGETDDIKLEPAVSDLRRGDGAASIAAVDIAIEPNSAVNVPADAPIQIKLTIDLAKASANGEFTGALYLYYEAGRQVIPLTVKVKAAPIGPWILMVVGVLLGTGLSIYRAEGRSRDEIVVQVGHLRTQMRGDPDLHKDFQISIESELIDVEGAVEDKDWKTAQAQVYEARKLWQRWKKYRDDWITQLRDGQRLITQNFDTLSDIEKSKTYLQGVCDFIDATSRKLRAGQYETPQGLKDDFVKVRKLLSQYKEGTEIIKHLKQQRSGASFEADREQHWLNELQRLEGELQNLTLDEERFKSWRAALEATKEDLETEIAALPSADSTSRSSSRRAIIETIPPAPSIIAIGTPEQTNQSKRNIKWSNQVGRVVAVTFLAVLGMSDLYANKATFGADPIRDYFSLLAWGFGAELTRESIVKAAQDLGVSITK